MYTEQETAIAQNLVKNDETMKFIQKLFQPDRTKVRQELEKNVAALSDEDYGRAMKALVLSEAHFATQFAELLRLGKEKREKVTTAVAPE